MKKRKLWICDLACHCVMLLHRLVIVYASLYLFSANFVLPLPSPATLWWACSNYIGLTGKLFPLGFSFPFPPFVLSAEHPKNFDTFSNCCCWLMLQALFHLQSARYVLPEHTGPAQVLLKIRFCCCCTLFIPHNQSGMLWFFPGQGLQALQFALRVRLELFPIPQARTQISSIVKRKAVIWFVDL